MSVAGFMTHDAEGDRRPWQRTPAEYRARAEECRQMAARAIDPLARSTFLRVAQSYEELAELAEHRGTLRKGRS